MNKTVVATLLTAAVAVVSGCSGTGSPGRVPSRAGGITPGTVSVPWSEAAPFTPTFTAGASATAPPTAPTTAATTAPTTGEGCDTPSKALTEWAGYAIASHPGPISASALVFAATTKTGDWYVVALDREYVLDNGTLTGDHSRDLGLTNAVKRRTAESKLIPISRDHKGKLVITWENVSWDGETLTAGKAAAALAVTCLDAQQAAS